MLTKIARRIRRALHQCDPQKDSQSWTFFHGDLILIREERCASCGKRMPNKHQLLATAENIEQAHAKALP